MLSTSKVVEFHHPYTDSPVGPGRWYVAYADSGEEMGYVWTNDRFGFGLITTSSSYRSQSTLDWFLYSRNVWGESETPATDAFESYYQMQATWSPAGLNIETGDLQEELLQRARAAMSEAGGYIEYGVTVRGDGEVLELLRHDPTGSYLRDSGRWVLIDRDAPEEQYPTVYNQEWHEVDEDILDFFDTNQRNEAVTLRDIELYVI